MPTIDLHYKGHHIHLEMWVRTENRIYKRDELGRFSETEGKSDKKPVDKKRKSGKMSQEEKGSLKHDLNYWLIKEKHDDGDRIDYSFRNHVYKVRVDVDENGTKSYTIITRGKKLK